MAILVAAIRLFIKLFFAYNKCICRYNNNG